VTIPPLKNPPIIELVIGFIFEPIESLNVLSLATYADTRRHDFPNKSLHPPVRETPGWFQYDQNHRLWMVSLDDQFVVQLQHDRMYVNWRKRGRYPRFDDHEGKWVLTRALEEFGKLRNYCEDQFGTEPKPSRIEVTKINQLPYSDAGDLHEVRIVSALSSVWGGPPKALALEVAHDIEGIDIVLRATNAIVPTDAATSILQIETRAATTIDAFSREAFIRLNECLNRIFINVFGDEALKKFQED
jgi:uncharacterized protein (TIGR04255 family)